MGLNKAMRLSTCECLKCGADRVLERPCDECGAAPRTGEINQPLAARRQLIRVIDALVGDGAGGQMDSPLEDPVRALTDWLEGFVGALRGLVADPPVVDAAQGMASWLLRLEALRERFASSARLRPNRLETGYVGVCDALREVWPLYREALTTTDIALAQRLSARAQRQIDEAPEALSSARLSLVAMDAIAESQSQDSLIAGVMRAVRVRYGDVSFPELVALGESRIRDTGLAQATSAASLDFLIVDLIADAQFDHDAFRAKVLEVSRCCGTTERLSFVASMDGALEGLAEASRDLQETLRQASMVMQSEDREGPLFRRLVAVVGEIYERALPMYAWLQLLSSEQLSLGAYSALVKKDATELVRGLQRTMPRSFDDLPKYLRNSSQHGQAIKFDAERNTVSVGLRSDERTISIVEYIDHVYAAMESLTAIRWALTHALDVAGIESSLSASMLDEMGVSQISLVKFWLQEFHGIGAERVLFEAGHLQVTHDGNPAEVFTLSVVLSRQRVGEAVTVCGPDGAVDGQRVLVSSECLERFWSDSEEVPFALRTTALVELRHASLSGGMAILSGPDVEFAVLVCGKALLEDDLTQVATLRRLMLIAKHHNFGELETLVKQLLATVRGGDPAEVLAEMGRRAVSATAPTLPFASSVTVVSSKVSLPCACGLPS